MNINDIRNQYATLITKDEYNNAKQTLPEDEFQKTYFLGYNAYYKRELKDSELQIVILDKILGWIKFFGVVAIIGIIGAIVIQLI